MNRPAKNRHQRPALLSRQQCGAGAARRGAAALEFVLVLPVLMTIMVGAADWGRVLKVDNVLMNAARSGACYGATHRVTDYIRNDWEDRIIARVADEAAHLPDFDPDRLEVAVETFDEADGSMRVSVDVSYPFETIVDWPGSPRQITLSRTVSMRGYR